jgi:hypothetical protein
MNAEGYTRGLLELFLGLATPQARAFVEEPCFPKLLISILSIMIPFLDISVVSIAQKEIRQTVPCRVRQSFASPLARTRPL